MKLPHMLFIAAGVLIVGGGLAALAAPSIMTAVGMAANPALSGWLLGVGGIGGPVAFGMGLLLNGSVDSKTKSHYTAPTYEKAFGK